MDGCNVLDWESCSIFPKKRSLNSTEYWDYATQRGNIHITLLTYDKMEKLLKKMYGDKNDRRK